MKKGLFLIILVFANLIVFSNLHWESIVVAESEWQYLPAISEPPANWMANDFDDTNWAVGTGGIGYGDDDDQTIIDPVNSLYLRKHFTIADTSLFKNIILSIDYDDAFVAYLNGTEIARSDNLTADDPGYNSTLTTDREAQMYQGGKPENYPAATNLLLNGENVLAVQILNHGINSSDLSSMVYLNAQIASDSILFQEIPDWFSAPLIFTESNLPIVVINTNNQTIKDNPKIMAHMGIINNGYNQTNALDDDFTDYDGQIAIEIRGESTQMFPKKPYLIETRDSTGANNNVSLLGMPEENDWILYAPYSDKSLLRNSLTFEMGRMTGEYCSKTKYCELVLNGNYQGIYILMEKIKIDQNRVNISYLDSAANFGDLVTGGYILRVDKRDEDFKLWYSGWPSDNNYSGAMYLEYQYFEPGADKISDEQKAYLLTYFSEFEKALGGTKFKDPDIGYNKYINVHSFIDFMLVNEISKEVDNYRYSTYFYKERDSRGGKLFAGPLWDFNLGYANVDYWPEGLSTSGWLYANASRTIYWWQKLRQDTYYRDLVYSRWQSLRQHDFSDENLLAKIDSITNYIHDAQVRNFQQWPILDSYIWPNSYVGGTYENEVQFVKDWLLERLHWMDDNINGRILKRKAQISQRTSATDRETEVKILVTLSNDYFSRPILKPDDFSLSGLPDNVEIDEVDYLNASQAMLHFDILGQPINSIEGCSVNIHAVVLNGYEAITSDTISLTATGLNQLNSSILKAFTIDQLVILNCENPELLPEKAEILNLSGQLVASYPLIQQYRNELETNLSANIYFLRIISQHESIVRTIRIRK